jgi:TonB family protein
MRMYGAVRGILAGVFVVASAGVDAYGQTTARAPLPQGRLIGARDGDTVVIEEDARVRTVRRRHAAVRAVFNADQRWLVLVVDYPPQRGDAPDGLADGSYQFRDVSGDWPLGERWEGDAIIEDYSAAGQGSHGVGLRTSQGFVQFLAPSQQEWFKDPAAAVLSFRGSGMSTSGRISFDEAEQRAVADMIRNLERNARNPHESTSTFTGFGGIPGGIVATATLTSGIGVQTSATGTETAVDRPVRVGSTLVTPKKIYDVPPVLPPIAQQAGVRGTVILELTVGADGAVTAARVLRSIPLLDAAAVEAARQWRYEPVLLNGRPVPVILTAAVSF